MKNKIYFQFNKIAKTPNSFFSHKLLAYAHNKKKQTEVLELLFYKYFIEGEDIGSLNDVEIASLGVDQVLLWDGLKWRNSESLNSRLDLLEDYIFPVDSNIDGGRAFVGQTTFLNGGSANIAGSFTTINGGSA